MAHARRFPGTSSASLVGGEGRGEVGRQDGLVGGNASGRKWWMVAVVAMLYVGKGHAFTHGTPLWRAAPDGFLRAPATYLAASTPTRRVPPMQDPRMMVGFLRGNNNQDREVLSSPEKIPVLIERPSMNSRRISASIIIDRPPEDVWSILTDYNNLATHVPNLVQSRLVDRPGGGLRLYQEGAQKIVGFDFSASLVMDMDEVLENGTGPGAKRAIRFKLVESRFFSDFDGIWQLQVNSRRPAADGNGFTYTTKLFYEVFIRPNGPVPVLPLEWRIREDVPTNLRGVKTAAERMGVFVGQEDATATHVSAAGPAVDWEAEETLELYMQDNQ